MQGVQAIGRLDQDTTGLLLLTDDGQFIHRMGSPRHHVPKVYEVTTKHPVDDGAGGAAAGRRGARRRPEAGARGRLRGRRAATSCGLTLTEGKYHQVKRMLAAVGNRVEALHRSRIGELTLPADLAPGQWRWLDADAGGGAANRGARGQPAGSGRSLRSAAFSLEISPCRSALRSAPSAVRPGLRAVAALSSTALRPRRPRRPARQAPSRLRSSCSIRWTPRVSVIDPVTWTEKQRIPTGKEPHHLYLTPDEKSLIVANSAGDSLTFLDPRTAEVQRVVLRHHRPVPPALLARHEVVRHGRQPARTTSTSTAGTART